MFAKIMAVVMAAILITTIGLSAVWWVTLRDRQIETRLDHLISEAEDIANLAALLPGNMMDDDWMGLPMRIALEQKIEKVREDQGQDQCQYKTGRYLCITLNGNDRP